MSAAPAHTALRRLPESGLIAGVCSGLGARLGLDPIILRVGFVATFAAGGFGVPLYALAWLVLPAEGDERAVVQRLLSRRDTWLVALGIGCLVLAGMLVLRRWGIWFSDSVVWPVVLAAGGAAVIWRQSTAGPPGAEPVAAQPRAPRPAALRIPADAASRAALGTALVVGGAVVFLYLNGALAPARDVVLAVVAVLVAATLILAPWWIRLARGLAAERAERIRSQERAEVAAHLHDSVLQTLALVQRRADDPRQVAALARRQERELRAWLNGARGPGTAGAAAPATLAVALEAAAVEVEELHQVPVEVVTVGDAPLDERAEALVGATREALVNAAKFAGPEPIALYAEVDDSRAEVFVRDRGPGFDPEAVPADRRGVRESIVGRMARHGGRAVVHSEPGRGTEVELVVER